ncbi:hypothetical protein LXL04_024818 [Taraxacum kok-saghyz]
MELAFTSLENMGMRCRGCERIRKSSAGSKGELKGRMSSLKLETGLEITEPLRITKRIYSCFTLFYNNSAISEKIHKTCYLFLSIKLKMLRRCPPNVHDGFLI